MWKKVMVCAILIAITAGAVMYAWPAKRCRVHGTITRDGKPLRWKGEKIMLQIIFAPDNRKENPEVYRCEGDPKEGTYVLPSVPSGKYRVSIQQMDPFPTHDLLQFKYGLGNSPLFREVSGDCEINIDLDKDLPR